MAGTKEAIAIVLDVGPSMNQAPPGEQTALQTSLNAINMILQRKLFSESKDEVALILFGTPDTANDLADDESYMNVTVARPLGVADWDLLQYVQNDIQPNNISADFLDALVVAMDTLMKGIQGKRGFCSKRVILLSDVGGEFGDDNLNDIVASMKEQEIEFNVIGPSLDDDDDEDGGGGHGGASNSHEKEKTPQQRAGEAMLKHLITEADGVSYSFSEALPALSFFQSRAVRPTPWKAQLEIGTNLVIPVSGYIKVKEAKAKSFKNVYARDPDNNITRLKTYHLNDEEETEIEQSDTVDGHRYGSTLVPFSEDDQDAMKFRAQKCFKVLGFTKAERVKRSQMMGDSCMAFVSEKGDEAAAMALSALISALYETNMVIIVRRVYSAASSPKLGVLTPHIKANYECLFYNDLPFTEDVRQFTFGSLPLTEETTATNKKFQPTDEQLAAMDRLIDNMDLTKVGGDDDDDEAEELLKPKLTFNPYLQRLYQCLQHRAMFPDDPLPELSPVIADYLKPSQAVLTKCEPVIEKMTKLFKLERVVKKKEGQTGDAMFKDNDVDGAPPTKKIKVDDDLGGGMAGLSKATVTEVGTVAPVEDFRAMIGKRDEDKFELACSQMQKRIIQIVSDSFGSQFYSKAMDCLKALRDECIKNVEPKQFNDYLHELKDKLSEKGRKDFWSDVIKEKISLITKMECEESRVTKEEASKFIAEDVVVKDEESPEEEEEDADDLLAMME